MKILCVRSAFLGDVVMSTASLAAIKQKHPDAKITYACWSSCADLLSLNPHVDALATAGKYFISSFSSWVDFRHEDLMDEYPETYWGELHARQAAAKGLLDADTMTSFGPELFVGPNDIVGVSELGDFAVINVFAQNGRGWRLWEPFDKWEQLVIELQKMGLKVVQLGGLGDPKVRGVDIQLCGKTKLAQSISVVASASLVVGIDSFIMHCAHATKSINNIETGEITEISEGTPAILLAGPVPWQNVVPANAKCIPVTNYPDCSGPCGFSHAKAAGRRICEFNNSCMTSIQVQHVLDRISYLMD